MDGRIDISEPWYFAHAPDAVWAIHDRYFASRPPDWPSLTHRLQLIAEERVGHAARMERAKEDAAFARAKDKADAAR